MALGALVLCSLRVLHLHPPSFGVLVALTVMGDVGGGAVASKVSNRLGTARSLLAAGLAGATAFAVLGLTARVFVAGGALILEAARVGVDVVAVAVWRQRNTPHHLIGRVARLTRVASNSSAAVGLVAADCSRAVALVGPRSGDGGQIVKSQSDPQALAAEAAEIRAHDRVIPALTGVRFFAAAWVVLFHFRGDMVAMFPAWQQATWFVSGGYLGVDLFFVLSGFVITFNYVDRFRRFDGKTYRQFLGLRLARMYPVQLATIAAVAVLVEAAHAVHRTLHHSYGLVDLVKNVLLINAWTLHTPHLSWDYPAWSISAEWFAYLLFPLLALLLIRVESVRVSAVCALAALFAYVGMSHLGVFAGSPLVRISAEFTAGGFLARLYPLVRSGRGWGLLALGSTIAVPCLLYFTPPRVSSQALVFPFAGIVIGLSLGRGLLGAFLALPSVVFLGEVSYSLYMTHAVILMFGVKIVSMETHRTSGLATRGLILLGYTIVVLAAAIGTYVLVERPARTRLRRYLH